MDYRTLYKWLYTSLQAELEKNFPDDEEREDVAVFFTEELQCDVLNEYIPSGKELTRVFRAFY